MWSAPTSIEVGHTCFTLGAAIGSFSKSGLDENILVYNNICPGGEYNLFIFPKGWRVFWPYGVINVKVH